MRKEKKATMNIPNNKSYYSLTHLEAVVRARCKEQNILKVIGQCKMLGLILTINKIYGKIKIKLK